MSPQTNSINLLKTLLHIGFFLSGITTVLIGQVLPILSTRLSLNDEQSGNFFIAQFSGSLIGTFLTNWFGRKSKFILASLIGCFLMAAGTLMLNLPSLELCLAGFFINGIGIGLTLPAINMLTIKLNPLRTAFALNFLNFFWGVGAIICSLTVYSLAKATGLFLPTAIIAGSLLLVTVLLVFIPQTIEKDSVADEQELAEDKTPIWTNPIAWAIAFFNFIHVGFESSMGGWLTTYSERLDNATLIWWLAPIFLYFLFFVIGRGIAPVFTRFLNENKFLMVSLIVILLGMIILLFAQNNFLLGIGASIAGFGTSSVFPTNLSRFSKTFGSSAIRRATPFFILGTLGATATTKLIGYVSNYFNNDLRSGMFILLASIIILIFLQISLSFSQRQTVK